MAGPEGVAEPRGLRRVLATRPSAALLAAVGGLLIAAALGWWLGGASHAPEVAVAPDSVAEVGDLRLELEAGWVAAEGTTGLQVDGAQAFAPVPGLPARALLLSGPPVDASLIPEALRGELPEQLPAAQKATLGGLDAWSYGPLRDRGRLVEVTIAPTTRGVLAVACTAPPASWSAALDCADGVHAVATERARALVPTADLGFRQASGPALRTLDAERVSGRARLDDARRAAATALARAHREAATTLAPFAVPGASTAAVDALRQAAQGYDALAAAGGNRARFVAARRQVARADAALAAALSRLRG